MHDHLPSPPDAGIQAAFAFDSHISTTMLIDKPFDAHVFSCSESKSKVALVQTFPSIADGFSNPPSEPFVVRNTGRVFSGLDKADLILNALLDKDVDVFGYDTSMSEVAGRTRDVVQRFVEGQLPISVLDASVEHLRRHLKSPEAEAVIGPDGMLTPILSPANAFTPLHFDPIEFGGGWMYLAQGVKDWVLIDLVHLKLFLDPYNPGPENHPPRLKNVDLDTILTIVPASAVRQAHIEAGDFLYFPSGWLHMVRTPEQAAVGIGGYH